MPCSLVEVLRLLGRMYFLQLYYRRKSQARDHSTLKMEAVYSSETSVNFCPAKTCYVPEDSALHCRVCENLKKTPIGKKNYNFYLCFITYLLNPFLIYFYGVDVFFFILIIL
jgi:hypothetical protein